MSFPLPYAVEPGTYTMVNSNDKSVTLQVDLNNTCWFILDKLPAGTGITYRLDTASKAGDPGTRGVTYTFERNTIAFHTGNSTVLSYFHGNNQPPSTLDEVYTNGGYIHPAYSPGGVPLTNHLDTAMHPHHYGIWAAWTNTEFQGRTPDFWNVQSHTGRIDHPDTLEAAWEGPVHGGLIARNHYVDLTGSAPVIALNEQWELRVFASDSNPGIHMFELVVTQTANTAQPLVLPEYHYGGMAFRGHANWDHLERVWFLTSEGNDRSNGNETRARWAHMGGRVDGETAGIAVLSHPSNVRAPQPVRIHPEIPYFVFAPVQLGEMRIEPGSPHVMRYRYITHDGKPDSELLDRLWNDFAYPPAVTVKRLGNP